jgi:signal transduction histidine kinase
MPLRRKLDILLGVPLVAVLVLLIPVSWAKFDAAHQWQSAADSMRVDEQVSVLVNDIETEQTVALGLQGLAGLPNAGTLVSVQQLRAAAAITDRQIAQIRSTLQPSASSDLGQALAEVVWETAGANGARAAAEHPAAINSYTVMNGYGTAVQELYNALGLDRISGAGGAAAYDEAEFDFLYTADLNEHELEADLLALTNDADLDHQGGTATLDSTDLADFEREYGITTAESSRFDAVASGLDDDKFQAAQDSAHAAFVNAEQKSIEDALADVDPASSVNQVLLNDQAIPAGEAGDGDLGLVQAAVNASKQRAAMEQDVTADLIGSAQHQADVARTYAYGLAAGALLLLLLLVVFEVRIRRSVVLPMLLLTRAARQVAEVTRADLERVADDDEGADDQALPSFETVPITTRDEIGDLGEAFNRVQDTAVRVLERQMAVRRNTAEMFGNVGRRIHNLTGRQLSLIDAAEREETDPSVLERLYRIDHLAVRLQRGADSLMLLSGEPEPFFGDAPLRLTDVVRSAVGRVEGYQRVVLAAEGDVTVAPAAVGDLTLIVAELVENAVSFSPATSSVDISVRPVATGASVEIVDHGVGMTVARLAEENARLVRRERLDLAPTKVLGLFVVGRLARRSGITVRLSATRGGGVTVRLEIGTDLLFDAPEPPARRRGPAQAARTVARGAPAPALPEQRATRARTGPTHAAPTPAPTLGPDDLPMRRRTTAAGPVNGHPAASPQAPADGSAQMPRRVNGAGAEDAAPTTAASSAPAPAAAQPTPDAPADAPAPHAPAQPRQTSPDDYPTQDIVMPEIPSPDLARRIRAAVDGVEAAPVPAVQTAPDAPLLPRRRSPGDDAVTTTSDTPDQAAPAAEGLPMALPRRSRNRATVREPAPPASAALAAAHRLDAEAARAAVEEFEAGVEEALRVSAQNLPTLRASDEPEGIRP